MLSKTPNKYLYIQPSIEPLIEPAPETVLKIAILSRIEETPGDDSIICIYPIWLEHRRENI